MTVRIGIDTGGTFTDLIGIDEATDQLVIAKTPSTPRRPAQAVINAIKSCGVPGEAIAALSIGTTVAANATLEFAAGLTYSTAEPVTVNGGTIRVPAAAAPNTQGFFAGSTSSTASGWMTRCCFRPSRIRHSPTEGTRGPTA